MQLPKHLPAKVRLPPSPALTDVSRTLQCQPAQEPLEYTDSLQISAVGRLWHPCASTLSSKNHHNTKTASCTEDGSYIIALVLHRGCVVLSVWHLLLAPNQTSQPLAFKHFESAVKQ